MTRRRRLFLFILFTPVGSLPWVVTPTCRTLALRIIGRPTPTLPFRTRSNGSRCRPPITLIILWWLWSFASPPNRWRNLFTGTKPRRPMTRVMLSQFPMVTSLLVRLKLLVVKKRGLSLTFPSRFIIRWVGGPVPRRVIFRLLRGHVFLKLIQIMVPPLFLSVLLKLFLFHLTIIQKRRSIVTSVVATLRLKSPSSQVGWRSNLRLLRIRGRSVLQVRV